jgi:hypothetical protein
MYKPYTDFIMNISINCRSPQYLCLAEVIEFGIALLEGGNQDIQKSLFNQLRAGTHLFYIYSVPIFLFFSSYK